MMQQKVGCGAHLDSRQPEREVTVFNSKTADVGADEGDSGACVLWHPRTVPTVKTKDHEEITSVTLEDAAEEPRQNLRKINRSEWSE